MTLSDPVSPSPEEREEDLLTRTQASAYLQRFHVRLKPQSLARLLWAGADGPPCVHIRRKPFYRRGELRRWALAQQTPPRRIARDEAHDGALD